MLGYGTYRVKLSQLTLDRARKRIAERTARRDAARALRARLESNRLASEREQEWTALFREMHRYSDRATQADKERAIEIGRAPVAKRTALWLELLNELKARPEPRPARHWAQR